MDFGLHFEVQNHKKSIKKRCRNRARFWRRKRLRKRSFPQGWRRAGVGGGGPRNEEFGDSGEDSERTDLSKLQTRRNLPTAGGGGSEGASAPAASPQKQAWRSEFGAKRCPNGILMAPFLVAWKVWGPLGRHLGGIVCSWLVLGEVLGSILGSLGGPWELFGRLLVAFGEHFSPNSVFTLWGSHASE